MQKSGLVTMTEEDLEEFHNGNVSDRLAETWNLTYNELREVVESQQYVLVSKQQSNIKKDNN